MSRTLTARWIGFVGLLVSMLLTIWVSHVLEGAVSDHIVIKILVSLLPLAFVPLASRTLPGSDYKPISTVSWILVLGLIFAADLAMEFGTEGWLRREGYPPNAFIAIMFVAVFFGALLLLRRNNVR
jgi:hypothetical protein